MAGRTLVIVNPASRRGATGRRWASIERVLRASLGPIEVERTRAAGDARRIAREGVRAGAERIVVAGGDGTLGDVVTGLLGAGLGGYAEIGLLPLGSGIDFARALGVPRDLDAAIEQLRSGRLRRLDAGRLTFAGPDGREATRYFANVASLGAAAVGAEAAGRAPRILGARGIYVMGALRVVIHYRSREVALRIDGRAVHDGPLLMAAAANGPMFGGGMRVSPEAQPDDGLLDFVWASPMSVPRMLKLLPAIYRGTHLGDPHVSLQRGNLLEAEAAPGCVRVEADGDPIGGLPLRIEVVPAALSVRVPAA